MRTTRLALFYQITQEEVIPPALRELERKDRWLKEMQKMVEAPYKPLVVKVTYELHDPEIENQVRFFNGTCVKYYAIQNELGMVAPSPETLKMYRETILDEMLGYDMPIIGATVRRRKSTTEFKSVQAWNKFLNTLQETLFDSAGFEFPDSKDFWELVKKHGYDEAERISTERLIANIHKKV